MNVSSHILSFPGELNDDHEELLIAANAARNASCVYCTLSTEHFCFIFGVV